MNGINYRLIVYMQCQYVQQAHSQDLEMGGSFSVSADRKISVCDTNVPARGSGALYASQRGPGQSPGGKRILTTIY